MFLSVFATTSICEALSPAMASDLHFVRISFTDKPVHRDKDFVCVRLFLPVNLHTDRPTLVVQHRIIGFTDTEPRVFVVAPCDKALNQSSLLSYKNNLRVKIACQSSDNFHYQKKIC